MYDTPSTDDRPLMIGSLFSGYGGLDLAVEHATGGRTAWFSELNEPVARVFSHHWPDAPNLGDITAVRWGEIEPVDVLCGGFPCLNVKLRSLWLWPKRRRHRRAERSCRILIMCPAPEVDLTRRARVREAALALFAERGYAGTSVRAIAEAAGVSSALVAHHFGSKSELRRACDQHVLATVSEAKDELGAADPAATIHRWLQEPRSEAVLLNYLARMLVEDPDSSGSLLEHLVSQTEQMIADGVAAGSIRAHGNPRMLAVVLTLQGLAPLVMQRPLRAILEGAPDLEAVTRQMAVPLLELYTHGLYTDSRLLDAARGSVGEGDEH